MAAKEPRRDVDGDGVLDGVSGWLDADPNDGREGDIPLYGGEERVAPDGRRYRVHLEEVGGGSRPAAADLFAYESKGTSFKMKWPKIGGVALGGGALVILILWIALQRLPWLNPSLQTPTLEDVVVTEMKKAAKGDTSWFNRLKPDEQQEVIEAIKADRERRGK